MRIRDEYLHGSDLTGVVKKIEVTIGTGNNANQSVIKYIKADSEGGVVEVPIGDITGKAATASKLDNTSAIGSKTNPVYFTANGVPSACTYSLNATIPAGTANKVLYYSASNTLDTQSYTTLTSNLDVFTVATANTAGKKGLVPAPSANQLGAGNFFLRADGVWTVIENKTAALNGTSTSLVTTGEKYNWNSAYNWYNSMTSGDTDGIINKWKEVEAFLANYGDSSTLAAELAKLVTLSTEQTITGVKTFSEVINGSITGNADTVDGCHESDFFRRRDGVKSNSDANDISLLGVFLNETGSGSNNSNYPEDFSDFFNFTAWYHTLFSCRSNFYWRTLLGNPAGKAWRTLLDSYNYTDYTVQKDGTGASGTWGINISGNSATASNATSAGSAIKSDYLTTRYIGSNGDTVAQVKLKILDSYTSLLGKQGYSIGVNYDFISKYSDDNYVINPNSIYSLTYLTPLYDGKVYGQWLAALLGSERLYVFGRNDGLWTKRKTIAWTSDIPTSLPANGGDADTATKLKTARTIWGLSFNGTNNVDGRLILNYSISTAGIELTRTDNSECSIAFNTNGKRFVTGIWGDMYHVWSQTSSNIINITDNGNVGVNTISPSSKLHVIGDIFASKGFKKEGSSDSYVLLGGGGHKAISDFATAGHSHSDTFRVRYEDNYVELAFRDRALSQKASETYIECYDSDGGWWNWKANKWIKVNSSDSYVLLGGGGHKAVSDFATAGHNHDGRYVYAGLRQNKDFNIPDYESPSGVYFVHKDIYTLSSNAPNDYGVIADFNSGSGHLLLFGSYDNNIVARSYWWTENPNFPGYPEWVTLIHSDNYNSYSPTLTGTGASGTWGIDISGNAATAGSAIKSDYLTTRYIGSNGDTVAQVKLKILDSYTSLAGKQGYSILVNSEFMNKYPLDDYIIPPGGIYSLTYLTPGYDGKSYGQWLASYLGSMRLYVFGRDSYLWTERKTIAWTSDIPTKVSAFYNDKGYLTSHAYSYGSIDIYDVNGAKKTSNNTVSASIHTETLRLQEGANISITATNSGDPGSDTIKIAVTGITSNKDRNGYGQLALWKNGASSVSTTLQSTTFEETLTVKAGSGIDFSGLNGAANNDIWTISAIPYNCAITLNNNSAKSLIKDSWSADKDSVYLTSNGTSGGTSLAAGTYALWIEDRSSASGTPNYYSGTFTCAGSATAGRLDEIALHSSMATNADTNAPTRIFVATQISSTSGKHVLRFCSLDSSATNHYLTVKINRII